MKLKVMEWNIHGAASMGWNNDYFIRRFVVDRILNEKAHIIILLEFVVSKGWDYLQSRLEEGNYIWFITCTSSENGILIAIKRDIEGLNLEGIEKYEGDNISKKMNTSIEEKPNFLQVDIVINNELLTIIGTRIRDSDGKSQFKALKEHLEYINNKVICIGDFNTWASYIANFDKWNLLPKDYSIHSPGLYKDQNNYYRNSWDLSNNCVAKWSFVHKNGGKAPLEHIIAKNVTVTTKDYSWDFVNKNNGYDFRMCESYKSDLIGLPDHAVLKAEIIINEN